MAHWNMKFLQLNMSNLQKIRNIELLSGKEPKKIRFRIFWQFHLKCASSVINNNRSFFADEIQFFPINIDFHIFSNFLFSQEAKINRKEQKR